jgi:hypothetical protein
VSAKEKRMARYRAYVVRRDAAAREDAKHPHGATSKYTDNKLRKIHKEFSSAKEKADLALASAICGTVAENRREYLKRGLRFPDNQEKKEV